MSTCNPTSLSAMSFHDQIRHACDPTACVQEAHLALDNLRMSLIEKGIGFDDVTWGGVDNEHLKEGLYQTSKLRKKIRELELELENTKSYVSDLLAKYESLAVSLTDAPDVADEAVSESCSELGLADEIGHFSCSSPQGIGYVSFSKAESIAKAQCQRSSWKACIAFNLGMTIRELNAWEVVGIFPSRLYDKISTLSGEECLPSSRKRWSEEEIEDLKCCIERGSADSDTARILTKKFNRRIYESSIAYRRRQVSRDSGWTVKNDGVSHH